MVLLHFQITRVSYNLIYSKGYILHSCFNRTSSYSQRLISGDITWLVPLLTLYFYKRLCFYHNIFLSFTIDLLVFLFYFADSVLVFYVKSSVQNMFSLFAGENCCTCSLTVIRVSFQYVKNFINWMFCFFRSFQLSDVQLVRSNLFLGPCCCLIE
jgi:hypothetical protein